MTERLDLSVACGQAVLRPTSQSASQTAPLVGEPLAKPFTLRGLPRPPLGRGGGTASAVTERFSSAAAYGQALLRTTSQSRRKLLDSSPSRGASGETVHFAGPAKASPFGRGVTEGDGEGKPGTKEPLCSDGQALCQSDTIAVSELFGSGLALSVGLAPASSPKEGAFGARGRRR